MNTDHPGRMPGLDVLRGLACLAVFAVHGVHSRYAESGWVAMSVFFVLSGYLITNTLIRGERRGQSNGAQLRHFFTNRALRILPALLIFLAVMVPITRRLNNGSDAGWGYSLVFVHNLYVMSAAHEFSFYFNHLWSLSVEEQFYLVYPWIFIFCVRSRSRILLTGLLVAPVLRGLLSALALQQPQWFTPLHGLAPGATPRDVVVYVSCFSHIDAFGLGGLMALHGERVLNWFANGWRLLLLTLLAMAIGGLVTGKLDGLLFRAFLGQAGHGQEIWGYTVLNLWACGLLGYFRAIQVQNVALAMLAALGRLSYEFYLVHFPVMIGVFATHLMPRINLPNWLWLGPELALSLLVAWLLHHAARLVTVLIKPRLRRLPADAVRERTSHPRSINT